MIPVVLALSASLACADYLDMGFYEDLTGGQWGFHYRYYRDGTSPGEDDYLVGGGTWTLEGEVSATTLGTPTYWPDSKLSADGTAATWTYNGEDLENPEGPDGSYSYFDVLYHHPSAHFDYVPYEIDADGDGTPETTGEVLAPTPEPGTMALALVGLGALAGHLRRRRRLA